MTSICFIVVWYYIILLSCQAEDCVFTDTNGSGVTLDLRTLNGKSMVWNTTFFNGTSEYVNVYTPCSNNAALNGCSSEQGNSSILMQGMFQNGDRDTCYGISVWDNGLIQPTYNNITETWSFTYNNGWVCGDDIPRQITYNWRCNPNIEFNVTSFTVSVTDVCIYTQNIDSSLACVSHTNNCIWKSLDGNNELDLSNLKGNIYSKTASNDITLNYKISPCSNKLLCLNVNSMAIIANNTAHDTECLTYLSIWDNGQVQPSYNSDLKSWQFIYSNGQDCHGYEDIFEIYWNCDLFAGEIEIITAKEVATCTYEMLINSKYACS